MIISNIHSRQNLNNRNWLLRTAGRNTCLFSFGWYFVEKLLNCYNGEYKHDTYPIHQFNGFSSVISPAGNGIIGRVPIYCNRSSRFRFQRQR